MSTDGQLTSGALLAGYRVVSLTGRGGMGQVYQARDERLDRDVALKVLSPEYAADFGFRARLVRESRLAANLDHPNVVPVYDAGEANGHVFIAMRFVDGTDLGAELRNGLMPVERAVAVAVQVAAALDAAHERGLVHRDVKPSNVLIDQRGRRAGVLQGAALRAARPCRSGPPRSRPSARRARADRQHHGHHGRDPS